MYSEVQCSLGSNLNHQPIYHCISSFPLADPIASVLYIKKVKSAIKIRIPLNINSILFLSSSSGLSE
jgi:hypothetical protein